MLSDDEKKAIEILKDNIKSLEGHTPFKHTNYKKVQAIETLLTAYEKEKEKNKNARYYIIDILNNDDIINIGIDDMKIILDILEE